MILGILLCCVSFCCCFVFHEEFLGSIVARGQIRQGDKEGDRVVHIIIIIVKNSG